MGDMPKSRKEAKEKGLPFFNDGSICQHGHAGLKRVNGIKCHECYLNRLEKTRIEYSAKSRCYGVKGRLYDQRQWPKWADVDKMLGIYQDAVDNGLDVDHIVPLKGNAKGHKVCGLHCESNLQLLPTIENSLKGFHKWDNMWEEWDERRRQPMLKTELEKMAKKRYMWL